MEKKERQFEEQDHPLKNTDRAYVQVGRNGEPVIPDSREEKNDREQTGEEPAVVYDRP